MNEVRLQKYMAHCGVASRRKCEQIISSGSVKVNDVIIRDMGYKIHPEIDIIKVNDKIINLEDEKVYILLNKPTGYVSTVSDTHHRPTVIDLIKGVHQRIYPVGRLDFDTSGLLILTNDGQLTNKITHPRHNMKKKYQIRAKGRIDAGSLKRLKNGVDIGGYITMPAEVAIVDQTREYTDMIMVISEGKNRQIRRMLEVVHHPVIHLKRIEIAGIQIGDLSDGKWRYLTDGELEILNNV